MLLDTNDELCMYIIVRDDLGMSRGKMCAQTGHVVGGLYLKYAYHGNDAYRGDFNRWLEAGQRKVVLAADTKEWKKVVAQFANDPYACIIQDSGYTEIPSGTQTACAVWPMLKSARPKVLKRLQSLK